jgi:ribosomal protein L29
MKKEDLTKKKDKELVDMLVSARNKIRSLRFSFTGSAGDVMERKNNKKLVAQILTEMKSRKQS